MPKRVLLVIGPGQSNEQGSGEEPRQNGAIAAPLRDPVRPNGSASAASMWPRLAELAAARGVWLAVHNTAVGSTSGADSWCGRCRAWASGIVVGPGSYVLSGGNVFKSGAAAGTAPTSTTIPAVGTGADGIPWTLARAATGEDTDGRVYAQGSALFDPNGYLAAAAAGITGTRGSWDEIVSVISIGQGDKTLSVTRAQYAQALQNAASYLLAQGATKVALGFTCYGTTSGLTAWYDAELVPGWGDALVALSGDRRVIAGANLYAALGVLPVSPANKATPGLKSDQLHMNNAALDLAAEAWRDALAAAGIV